MINVDLKTDDCDVSLMPKRALVFYGKRLRRELVAAATVHQFNGHQLLAGRPMSLEDVNDLLEALAGRSPKKEIMPEHVLFKDAGDTLWWHPQQQRPMWFLRGRRRVKHVVPWPALVFHVRGQTLRVVALNNNERPSDRSRIYHAPLMNIYADDRLCMGNISPPGSGIGAINAWESAIYDTVFTHVNHDLTLKFRRPPANGNLAHYRFWSKLERDNIAQFPVKRLVPHRQSLLEWFNEW